MEATETRRLNQTMATSAKFGRGLLRLEWGGARQGLANAIFHGCEPRSREVPVIRA